jgi:hypothetical protein
MIDHALASAMQGLDVLLLDGLLWNQWNVGLARCGADRFGVVAAFFCRRTNGFTYCGLMILT